MRSEFAGGWSCSQQRDEIEVLYWLRAAAPQRVVAQAMRRFLAGSRLSYRYGYRPTWPPRGCLSLDHIMTGGGLTVRVVEVPSDPISSNHLPVIALIDWPAD